MRGIGSNSPPIPSLNPQGSENSMASNANAVAPSSASQQELVPLDGRDFLVAVSEYSLQPSPSGVYTQAPSSIQESIDVWSREVVTGEDRHAVAQQIQTAWHDSSNKLNLLNLPITTLPRALPSNIKVLNVSGCASLTKIEPSIINNLERLNIKGCTALTNTRFPDGLEVIR